MLAEKLIESKKEFKINPKIAVVAWLSLTLAISISTLKLWAENERLKTEINSIANACIMMDNIDKTLSCLHATNQIDLFGE